MHDKLDGLYLTTRQSGELSLRNAANNSQPLCDVEIWDAESGLLHSFEPHDRLQARGEVIFKSVSHGSDTPILLNRDTGEYVVKTAPSTFPAGFPGTQPIGTWHQETRHHKDTSIPCFTAGTIICTRAGEKRAEDLCPGDEVITRDSGFVPIQAISHQTYSPAEQRLNRNFRPIVIPAGTFNNARDLHLSPAHRLMIADTYAELMFGEPEVLVAAKTALEFGWVHQQPAQVDVAYYHILLPKHELMLVEGIWVESLFLGDMPERVLEAGKTWDTLAGFDMAQARHDGTVRPVLRGHEARSLMQYLPDSMDKVVREQAPNDVFVQAA